MDQDFRDITGDVMMDKKQLEEIKARCEAATPGPWTSTINWSNDRTRRIISEKDEDIVIKSSRYGHDEIEISQADKWFILCARSDVPALVAEVERLNGLVYHYQDVLSESNLL